MTNDASEEAQSTKFVIATLPDPQKTHLALTFDRLIESRIQQAASQECLTYDSSWLPWQFHEPYYTGHQDQEDADQEHEEAIRQPGILLFRDSGGGKCGFSKPTVALFIVGETPTGGVDKEQFVDAINWIR